MLAGILAAAACVARPPPSSAPARLAEEDAGSEEKDDPSPYVLTPGSSGNAESIALGKSEVGVIVDGVRIVMSGRRVRVARQVAISPLQSATPIPARMGGGFLFRGENALYTSDRFDGDLRALAYFPGGHLSQLSFASDTVLVRANDGQRWMLGLPGGARVPVEPPSLVDLAARDDGRVVVLTDRSRLLVSIDGGKTFRDGTEQLRSAPQAIERRDDALYVSMQEGQAVRLETDGRLSRVEQIPELPPPEKDPRWRPGEPPLRFALRVGAMAEDESTAIVATNGDIVRLALRSGSIVSVQSGKVPPDATCEAVRTPEDVLFLCARRSAQERIVISGTLFGKVPSMEQSFAAPGTFFVGDDGAVAFGGPCAGPHRDDAVCVRTSGGSWREHSATGDAGASLAVQRWVPRSDGSAVGLVFQGQPSLIDTATGDVRIFADGELPTTGPGTGGRGHYVHRGGGLLVDREWSFTPEGSLRGWIQGRSASIPTSGPPTSSAFVGDQTTYGLAGPFALGLTNEGRLFQTIDRGLTWSEVAAPPSLASKSRGGRQVQCSALGCLLGPWLRLGYPAQAPSPLLSGVQVPPPAEVSSFASAAPLECEPDGPVRARTIGDGDHELGLGAVLLPQGAEVQQFPRMLVHPVNSNEPEGNDEVAKRAVIHGVGSGGGLRQTIHWLAPFDPAGAARTQGLGAGDIASGARAAGVAVDDLLSDFSLSRVVPVTPADPAAPGDLLFSNDRVLVHVRASGGVRVGVLAEDPSLVPISAAVLPQDELAVLLTDATTTSVQKLTRTGAMVQLFEWKAPGDTERYPANPDSLALGPRGEVGILRLSSGSEPASKLEPARVLLAKGKEIKLAPWSTLRSASDPACRAEPGGYRATVQLVAEWIEKGAASERPEAPSHMLARVRWSEARVCLEGVEVRLRGAEIDRKEPGRHYEQWLVARAWPTPQAARLAVGSGFELRQGQKCQLK